MPESQWDTPLDYEAFAEIKAMIGHGGIVVFDDTVDMAAQARFSMEFAQQSPVASARPAELVRCVVLKLSIGLLQMKIVIIINLLQDLCDTMEYGSLCAMGGMTPTVRVLYAFASDFDSGLSLVYPSGES